MTSVVQDPGYGRLKSQLIEATGLAFYTERDTLLCDRIEARLAHLGLPNCAAYISFLASGKAGAHEMELLIAQLTISETYFFRDRDQFAAIRELVLPDILERNKASKELRIWSAGCSTGAEPYSLAILLMDHLSDQIADWKIRIYASDLNRDSLARAAEGRFRAWALRDTAEQMRHECFLKDGGSWTIHPRFKPWVSFHHMNLVGGEFSSPLSQDEHFDLILCRNVMIYFTAEVGVRLIADLHGSLAEEGWLVVGAAEYNPENFGAFRTVATPGALLYQKMAVREPGLVAAARPFPVEFPTPSPIIAARQPILALTPCEPEREDLAGLCQLADQGEWQSASAYGERLLAQDRLNPALHFYRALILENLGNLDESARSLRQAIYLDRNFALAHYHLGLALKRNQQSGSAARSFENAVRVLKGLPKDAMVSGGPGITVGDLRGLAQMQVENPGYQAAKV